MSVETKGAVERSYRFTLRTCERGPSRSLRHFDCGTDPALVCLHAAGGLNVSPALRQLATRLRVLAPVFPGLNGTPKLPDVVSIEDLARLVAQFAGLVVVGPYFLLGHSLGGHVAASTAVLGAARVRKLVLACPAGFRESGTRPCGDPIQRLYVHPERIPQEAQCLPAVSARNRAVADCFRGDATLDRPLPERLTEICAPTLLLHSRSDRTIGLEASQLVTRHIVGSRLECIDDAGHIIDVDQPEAFIRVVENFLNP